MANFDIYKVVANILDTYNPEPTDVLGNERKQTLRSKIIHELCELEKKQKSWEESFGRNSAYARYADALGMLCPEITEGLMSGNMAICDATVYSVTEVGLGCTRLFERPKQVGVTNINKGKTPADRLFLLSDIRLLYRDDLEKDYSRIPYWMQDDEFVFTAGLRNVATLQMSDFDTATQTVTLTNPIPMRTQEHYDAVVTIPYPKEDSNEPERLDYRVGNKGYLKVLLHGLMVYRK